MLRVCSSCPGLIDPDECSNPVRPPKPEDHGLIFRDGDWRHEGSCGVAVACDGRGAWLGYARVPCLLYNGRVGLFYDVLVEWAAENLRNCPRRVAPWLRECLEERGDQVVGAGEVVNLH